jgi:IS30 family transposase
VLIGKLRARTAAEANRALLELLARHPGRVATITSRQRHGVPLVGQIEAVHPVKFYFAMPHHSWLGSERNRAYGGAWDMPD